MKFDIAIRPFGAPDDYADTRPKHAPVRRKAPRPRIRPERVGEAMGKWLGLPFAGWHEYLDDMVWLDFRRADGSLQPLIFKAAWLDGELMVLVQRLQDCVRDAGKRRGSGVSKS